MARDLVPDEAEQAALADIVAMREARQTLVAIRDAVRANGHRICKQTVANVLARRNEGAAA